MSDWQNLHPYGQQASGFTSLLDMRRSATGAGRTPYADYPDGYLGNVNSRRDDRLLRSVQSRLTQRNYQRGVHKGDAVDPQDYYWNDVVDPEAGIRAQMRGQRWTARGTAAEQINHLGKNHLLTPEQVSRTANEVGVRIDKPLDPVRRERMSRLLPDWR